MAESQLNRRDFIRGTAAGAALLALGIGPESVYAGDDVVKLIFLHTNDVHSRIDPFPMDGSRNQGMGGVAGRASLIKKIRQEEKNVLLLDAGDIFQGTPYFNFYGGELEIKMMSMMGYDAGIMGNHDFDNGIEGFHKQLPHANFPILNANYDFSDTLLNGKTQPYKIFKRDGLKIGVFGLGIELNGLVNKQQYGNTIYMDPLPKALEMERFLKLDQHCDLVVCLSHLGYKYDSSKVSDLVIARNTNFIDLIIGGHTHTFMDKPDSIRNLKGTETLVNQVGFAGINLGRIDFIFQRKNAKKISYSSDLQSIKTNFKI
ncbi:bifunctional metallophosphatase/5'-nucleotidase [Daejeonella lutea]|uniref:5'-nucleotidase n=1 Tax=Daejeonella lutea TaxID=572036 RepID=A0A1T5FEZ4_9SPHI|nr:metallophosphatase [Daejeonella lutea]SKB94723.1 5'-nucleotidase [Daejeonella lutea]